MTADDDTRRLRLETCASSTPRTSRILLSNSESWIFAKSFTIPRVVIEALIGERATPLGLNCCRLNKEHLAGLRPVLLAGRLADTCGQDLVTIAGQRQFERVPSTQSDAFDCVPVILFRSVSAFASGQAATNFSLSTYYGIGSSRLRFGRAIRRVNGDIAITNPAFSEASRALWQIAHRHVAAGPNQARALARRIRDGCKKKPGRFLGRASEHTSI